MCGDVYTYCVDLFVRGCVACACIDRVSTTTVSVLNTAYQTVAGSNFVTLYDGGNTTSRVLAQYTAGSIASPTTVNSTGPYMLVTWVAGSTSGSPVRHRALHTVLCCQWRAWSAWTWQGLPRNMTITVLSSPKP